MGKSATTPGKVAKKKPQKPRRPKRPGIFSRDYTPKGGRRARCKGCQEEIEYTAAAILHHWCYEDEEQYLRTDQYHCTAACLAEMLEDDLEDFLAKVWNESAAQEAKNTIIQERERALRVMRK